MFNLTLQQCKTKIFIFLVKIRIGNFFSANIMNQDFEK